MAQLTYITPRLVIVHSLEEASTTLANNHGSYFYLFNLSKQDQAVQTYFHKMNVKTKNRGYPFSFKITLQLCMQLDRYFFKGLSNTAAFYCPDNEFGACAIICYMYVSGRFKQMSHAIEYFLSKYEAKLPTGWLMNFQQFFDNLSIVMPPVKILKRVVLKCDQDIVPIFEVSRQSRFQELQSVYQHPIQDQLQEHYHHIVKAGFHTKKPQTTYVFKPVVLAGDFRIDMYSYESMRPQKILTIGSNTLFIDTDTVSLQGSDLYENTVDPNAQVILEFDQYCQCNSQMLHSKRCYHCIQELKSIKKEYNELVDLSSQFSRHRKPEAASRLVFGSEKFDDVKG